MQSYLPKGSQQSPIQITNSKLLPTRTRLSLGVGDGSEVASIFSLLI